MKVRITVPGWLASKLKLASYELEGVELRNNGAAILFSGHAVVRESETCLRCGREITNQESRMVGYGAECAQHVGIPRDFEPHQVPSIREFVKAQTQIETWLPLAKIQIEYLEGLPTATKVVGGGADKVATRIWIEGNHILVRAPFEFKDALKEIPSARWSKQKVAWAFPVSPMAARSVFTVLRDAKGVDADRAFTDLVEQSEQVQAAQANKRADNLPPIPITKFPAWRHQLQAYHFAYHLPGSMLAMAMGTGKTKVTVDLIVNRGSKRTLIMCPKKVVGVWPKEFRKHTDAPVHVVPLKKGTIAKRVELAKKEMALANARAMPIVIVINYESAWRDPFAAWALSVGFDCIVCDESHKIKSPSGKAALFAAKIGAKAKYRMCLTGTPMPHSPLDVYAQYRFLDPGIYGTNYAKFRARYAIMGGFEGRQVLDYQNKEELNRKFYSIAFRVGNEVLDLPKPVHMNVTCELGPEARKFYKELEKEMFAAIPGGQAKFDEMLEAVVSGKDTVTVENALTKLLRLQQIASGFVQDDEKYLVSVDDAKKDTLTDILDDLPTDEPVIVFCRFTHDLDAVKEVAEQTGRRYGEVSGRCDDLVESCMPEDIDIMAVQIQAGGAGVDLTRAHYAIYYSKGFNMGDYEQSLARIDRPGQTQTPRFIHIVAEDTVDEKLEKVLAKRKETVDDFLKEA